LSLAHENSNSDALTGSEPVTSSGRRNAVRSLAGIGAAGMTLLGRGSLASHSSAAESGGESEPGLLAIKSAKKKKKGKKGSNGSDGVRLTQKSQDFSVPAGSNANGQVNCSSGQATGGGVGISNAACSVVSSGPVGAKAWGATVGCPAGQTATASVTVICIS
jgi:hypothetical protein